MARGTLRCGLFLIFGLSSIASTIGIASAVLDLVSRVGTQVGTPTPTRTHADTPARAAIPHAADATGRVAGRGQGHTIRVCSLSPLTLKLQTKL
jgi:hypothetical protein